MAQAELGGGTRIAVIVGLSAALWILIGLAGTAVNVW